MEVDFYNQPKREPLEEITKPVEASPFDIVNNINEKKGYLADVVSEGGYIPWVINKSLSFFSSDVLYANDMNLYANELTFQQQYDYFYYAVPKGKKWSKWPKFKITDDEKTVMEYFQCSWHKAKENLRVLTSHQLKEIVDYMKEKNS
jgi:hypothetical protein